MESDDKEGEHGADLGLSLSERMLDKFEEEIDSLRRGDYVEFNATIRSIGDSHHLHHLHTFSIKKLPGHRDVEAHHHANGRYAFRTETNHPEGSFGSDPNKVKIDTKHTEIEHEDVQV